MSIREDCLIKTIKNVHYTRYDYKNIKKILLIKELLDEGYTLDASAEKVKNRMELIEETLNKIKKSTNDM